MPKPWERRADESSPAWEAFQAYCLMGLGRNQRAVGRNLGKSGALISGWSSKYSWVERCVEWDRIQAEESNKAATRVVRSNAEKWARRDDLLREALWRPMSLVVRHGKALIVNSAESGRDVNEEDIRALTAITDAAAAMAEKALAGKGVRDGAETTRQIIIPDADDRGQDDGP